MSLTNDDIDAIDDIGGEFSGQAPQAIDENYEFDSSESTEEALQTAGQIEHEGWYHFEISKIEWHLELVDEKNKLNTPHFIVTCKSLAEAKGLSPAGAVLWHRVYVGQKDGGPAKQGSIDSMFRFGIGCGLLKWGRVRNADGTEKAVVVLTKTGLPKIPLTAWNSAVGMQFVAQVKKGKDQIVGDKTYPGKFEIPMGRSYRPDHPDVSQVPKNKEALEAIGIVLPEVAPKVSAKTATTATTAKPSSSSAGKVASPAAATTTQAPKEQPTEKRETVAAAASSDGFNMDDY